MPRPIIPIKKLLSSEVGKANTFAIKWLAGRIAYLYSNATIPGAFNLSNYTERKFFDVGNMYMYLYDPKLKQELPYWDKFPLVIPLEIYGDGWLGLNLHYLSMDYRIALLNQLLTLGKIDENNKTLKLAISYQILNNATKFAAFRPCVKRYLRSHVRSRILPIFPHEYTLAAYLPTAKFQKRSQSFVWNESRQMINDYKSQPHKKK